MKFTEAKLEQAFIELLEKQNIPYTPGHLIDRNEHEVLIKDDLRNYLHRRYDDQGISDLEIDKILLQLESLSALDLYESNKKLMRMLADGFILKREDPDDKDLYIELIDYSGMTPYRQPEKDQMLSISDHKASYEGSRNMYRMVNQMEIIGDQKRIPDGILYINGLPLVVFEFKTAIEENCTIHNAYEQLTIRYKRDIPELFKYNAFCVISDGVNNKAGSFFAPYEYYYAWRRLPGMESDVDGISSMYSMIEGMLNPGTLRDIIRNFIFIPDASRKEEKILCRYPQYYAANKLYSNIIKRQKPEGDGKGGTYFGATGSGKSYTMLFLTRLLMRSKQLSSPTIVLITDRTDLDDQLSEQFEGAKAFIGDNQVVSVSSRENLRDHLRKRQSGGVFLTTIHKFTEDTKLLTERSNVICISDEAHRSQVNLDQKIRVTENGVKKTYGFAKYLHDSLPNATYVGFTGTPIDATLDVFGEIVDAYTMNESVRDEITVRIVYEGRAAKVALKNSELEKIETYYKQCAEEGANEKQIETSKKASASMHSILGDPDRLDAVADDFIEHYETRVKEGATVNGKAMFVCANRDIAWDFYKLLIEKRPEWAEVKTSPDDAQLTDKEKKDIMPLERVKMVMTRGKDDPDELYKMLGTKEYRKELDRQFKNEKSNFKIAIVVDMWLTGFDVPCLDTIYIDKPVRRHSLIQTISRVNRKYKSKEKGLVVDYIGIKKQMNMALKHYSDADEQNFENIDKSLVVVFDHLDLLKKLMHKFDASGYYNGSSVEQLHTLNMAAEFVQQTQDLEKRFMYLVERLKAAYDICVGSEQITQEQRDQVHFYLAVRSILIKITRGDAPDAARMNARVREMIQNALASEGIEEIYKIGEDGVSEEDLFSEDYLARIDKIKLPNTKIKLLQKLLAKAIDEFRKTNRAKAIDFSKRMESLVKQYNERKADKFRSEVLDEFTDEIMDLFKALQKEKESFKDMGIDFEEKAFYDILKSLAHKYDFTYPEEKLLILSKEVKKVVDDKAKYTDWSHRDDIKSELKADLIVLLAKHNYPPVDRDEVYKEIFEQAENFKKNR
ncbi:MAG: type I restriction endonuclease subunit R [Bacteroidales bacterium]